MMQTNPADELPEGGLDLGPGRRTVTRGDVDLYRALVPGGTMKLDRDAAGNPQPLPTPGRLRRAFRALRDRGWLIWRQGTARIARSGMPAKPTPEDQPLNAPLCTAPPPG